ncbi:DUF2303 family protein, partial [Agrobacterium rhizogenes]|nr:DUF2303 family protein [Rhizobium rhizogenes]
MTNKTNDTIATLEAAASPLLNVGAPVDLETLKELCDAAGSDFTLIANDAKAVGIPDTIPVFIDRKSGKPESVKSLFDEWRITPVRKKGTAVVKTLESFTGLTKRHATGDSVIFADTNWREPSLMSIIDYHAIEPGGSADNCSHRILYPFPLTEEWQAWVSINGKPLNQGQFAEFIEDHRADLAAP